MKTFVLPLVLSVFCGALTGCASTPEPVKATTAHTGWMLGRMQQDLSDFETAATVGNAIALKSQVDIADNAIKNRNLVKQSLRAEELAGNDQTIKVFNAIKTQTDFIRHEEAELAADRKKLNERTAALFKPLSNVLSTFPTAANAVAAIGQDLPSKTALEESAAVMKAVWKNTQENREKLSQAIGKQ